MSAKMHRAWTHPETKPLLRDWIKWLLECKATMDDHPLAPLITGGTQPFGVPVFDTETVRQGVVLYDYGDRREVVDVPSRGDLNALIMAEQMENVVKA